MRIISKFRDYYDSVQAHGTDERLVYRRAQNELRPTLSSFRHERVLHIASHIPMWPQWDVRGAIIVFCGKVYPFWMCGTTCCWQPSEIEDHIRRRSKRKDLRANEIPSANAFEPSKSLSLFHRLYPGRYRLDRKDVTRFLETFDAFEVGPEIHIEYSAPVIRVNCASEWHFSTISLVTNPCLADTEFFRRVDPFTAYQEIAMYLGNELAQPDIAPQTVGSDKDIAKAKGFDDQSFRTAAPGQKKTNRKANRARKQRR